MAVARAVKRNQAHLLKRAAKGSGTPSLQAPGLCLGSLKMWHRLMGDAELRGWGTWNWSWEPHLPGVSGIRNLHHLSSSMDTLHSCISPSCMGWSLYFQKCCSPSSSLPFPRSLLHFFLQMRKVSLREITQLVQGHMVNARVGIRVLISMTQEPEILASKPSYLPNFDVTYSTCYHIIS